MVNISSTGGPITLRSISKLYIECDIFDETYVVRDPFNTTYNPARTLKLDKRPFWFREECKKALAKLNKGMFIL